MTKFLCAFNLTFCLVSTTIFCLELGQIGSVDVVNLLLAFFGIYSNSVLLFMNVEKMIEETR